MPVQPMSKKVPCECRRATRTCPGIICEECKRRETFEWRWEKDDGSTVVFNNNERDVIFNPGFSVGTAAVRGTQPFKAGCHHFWEIEMSTEVYGTDMMIGVGTDKTDLRKYSHNFVSLLGLDEHSWGLSYSGEKKHAGQSQPYSRPFGQNSIIGVHLDLWAGTLEFYLDRKPLGLAFHGLRDKQLYPIISSTAARSGMNLIFCRSYSASLQLQAMLSLSQNLCPSGEENGSIFKCLPIPPGMKQWMKHNYWWIVSCKDRDRKREEELNNRAKCVKQRSRSRKRVSRQREPGAVDDQESEVQAEASGAINSDTDEDEEEESVAAPSSRGQSLPKSPKRHVNRRLGGSQHQCTRSIEEGGGNAPGGTSCMRLLAATSSRAHFLGRVSPIFVGLPEGGFSILSMWGGQTANGTGLGAPNSNVTPTTSVSISRSTARSRSVPAQPTTPATTSTSTSGTTGISAIPRSTREAASSEDEDSSGPASARREPKRLRLRTSIDAKREEEKE